MPFAPLGLGLCVFDRETNTPIKAKPGLYPDFTRTRLYDKGNTCHPVWYFPQQIQFIPGFKMGMETRISELKTA